MNFRTEIQLSKERNQIDYNANILLIGSCFSENISKKLYHFKFNTSSNPFGIIFNPIAIETLITNAVNEKVYTENEIFQRNEQWHCFDTHSDLSSADKTILLQNLNEAIRTTHQQLTNATHILITLGTSRVYRFIETDTIVGNCHKVPQKKFLRELLTVDEIMASLDNISTLIKAVNPKTNIIFTVSPVRHLKDGFIENSQSKAHLLAAIHQLVDPRKQVYYFPSYEIMLDDLRDYRFYNSDMIHPNETAIEYIWEQFINVWIHENSLSIMKEVDSIQKGLAHKPFNPNSEEHKLFLSGLQTQIQDLQKRCKISF
jgi:lysophospholipase L1-like esterase